MNIDESGKAFTCCRKRFHPGDSLFSRAPECIQVGFAVIELHDDPFRKNVIMRDPGILAQSFVCFHLRAYFSASFGGATVQYETVSASLNISFRTFFSST